MKTSVLSAFLASLGFCGSAAAAEIYIENASTTDTLFVAALYEPAGSHGVSQPASGTGFWKVAPGERSQLKGDDAGLRAVWLRILVQNGDSKREYVPINSENVLIRGRKDCRLTSPGIVTCSSMKRFSVTSGFLSVVFDTADESNYLFRALGNGGEYRFFPITRNAQDEFFFKWK
jgi:hypothetical protein